MFYSRPWYQASIYLNAKYQHRRVLHIVLYFMPAKWLLCLWCHNRWMPSQHPCTDELIISETTCPNAKLRECRVRTQTSDSMFFKLRRLSLLIRTETLVQERGALRRGRLALGNAGLRLMSGQCFLSLLEIQTFHKPSSISQTRLALSLAESRVLVVPFSIRKKS